MKFEYIIYLGNMNISWRDHVTDADYIESRRTGIAYLK